MVDDLRDGDTHILAQHNQRDKKAIVELDLATAKEGKVLFGHLDEDADGLAFP